MGKKGARNKQNLLNPGQVLNQKNMWQAANAATRIELRPALKAYSRQHQRLKKDEKRETKGLRRLSRQTAAQTQQAYRLADRQLAANQDAMGRIGNQMQQSMAAANTAEADRMRQLQEGTLGGQIASLSAQGIPQGSSASQQALADAASRTQGERAALAESWQNLATTQAMGANEYAANIRAATQNQAAASTAGIRQALASRIAQAKAEYGAERRDVRGKIADQKALFGPTRLQNIMKLRESDRAFINERAAIKNDRRQAALDRAFEADQNALDRELDRELDRNNDNGGGNGGGDGGNRDDVRLNKQEWRNWRDAGDELLGPKGRITNMRKFLNELAKQEGVNWTGTERKKFKRRYRKYRAK